MPTNLLIFVIWTVVFMVLKELLKREIKAENFQGIVIRVGNQSEAHWWAPGETTIYKVLLDFEVRSPFSFNCIQGKIKILEV